MDLSDGSDGEEFAANEIDENYLLGSDDEDQHQQKGQEGVQGAKSSRSKTMEQLDDNDGDYLDLETGDDDELGLQSFSSDVGQTLAPVKVRNVVQEKSNPLECRSTSIDEEDNSEYYEDSTNDYSADLEDETNDNEPKSERSKFHTERAIVTSGVPSNKSSGSPIKSLGGKQVRLPNFNGPLFRGNHRLGQHQRNFIRSPQQFMMRPPGPGFFGRGPPPHPQNRFNGNRPLEPQIFQFQEGIFTDFSDPSGRKHMPHLMPQLMYRMPSRFPPMRPEFPRQQFPIPRPLKRNAVRQSIGSSTAPAITETKPSTSSCQKPEALVAVTSSENKNETKKQDEHEVSLKDSPKPEVNGENNGKQQADEEHQPHPAVIITIPNERIRHPPKKSKPPPSEINNANSASAIQVSPESQGQNNNGKQIQPVKVRPNFQRQPKPQTLRHQTNFRNQAPFCPRPNNNLNPNNPNSFAGNIPPVPGSTVFPPPNGPMFQRHPDAWPWNPAPPQLMQQHPAGPPQSFPANFQHPDLLSFPQPQSIPNFANQNQMIPQNPIPNHFMTGPLPPVYDQQQLQAQPFFEQQHVSQPFFPNQGQNFHAQLVNSVPQQQPYFNPSINSISQGENMFNPNFQQQAGMHYQFHQMDLNKNQPPLLVGLDRGRDRDRERYDRYVESRSRSRSRSYERKDTKSRRRSRSPVKRRYYDEDDDDEDSYRREERRPKLHNRRRHSSRSPEIIKDKEAELVKIIMETKKEMGLAEDDEYLKKIEEQKRKREEILRLKAQRRKGLIPSGDKESSKESSTSTATENKGKNESIKRPEQKINHVIKDVNGKKSIHLNPKAFSGELLSALNTNLKKINMNVTSAPSSVKQTSQAQTVVSKPSLNQLPATSKDSIKLSGDSKNINSAITIKTEPGVSNVDKNVKKGKTILRIVKNKKGEIISRSKVVVTTKSQHSSPKK